MTEQQKYADKIAALLRKAEGNTTPEEAELLMAKAQELMTKYAIDEAMLEAARGKRDKKDQIITEEFVMTGGFRVALGNLCSFILKYSDCKCVLYEDPRMVEGKLVKQTYTLRATGWESDLKRARMLHTSLMLQAAMAQTAWFKEHKDDPEYAWDKRALFLDRRQFLFSFANTIGKRLREGYDKAHVAAAKQHGTGMELVLRDRTQAVLEKYEEMYPNLRKSSQRQTGGSWRSAQAGAQAGSKADIGGTKLPGSRKQISH